MADLGEGKYPFAFLFPEGIREKISEIHISSLKEIDPKDKRSKRAILAESILRAVNDGHLSSVEAAQKFLQKRAAEEDGKNPLLLLISRMGGEVTLRHGMHLASFGSKSACKYTVLYLHGGAYTEEALPFHVSYCSRLSERIDAFVYLPLYPLAPNHTWRETYWLLTDLYTEMLGEKRTGITIMGDSAGGGLAIAFCQYLKTLDLPQPDHLIGLSPWVDICMTDHDYEPYRSLDPMLDVPGLQIFGKAWADDLDVRDPRVSPVFGDNHGLPKTLLFTGTREILYPDICDFYEKMRADGCDVELVIGEGMNHVYPLYGIPESREAISRIDREICGL